jgi:hypothetical protein
MSPIEALAIVVIERSEDCIGISVEFYMAGAKLRASDAVRNELETNRTAAISRGACELASGACRLAVDPINMIKFAAHQLLDSPTIDREIKVWEKSIKRII